MTQDEHFDRTFAISAITTLCAAYEGEHDWDADEDPTATRELLADARALTAEMLVPSAQSKVGWKEYKVTEAAFEKICQAYEVSTECLL